MSVESTEGKSTAMEREDERPEAEARTKPEQEADRPEQEGLDLLIERIDTEGVMKEGFTGQEM